MRCVQVVALTVLLADFAGAQSPALASWPLDSGSKVRVQASTLGGRFHTGTLLATTPDSIMIAPKNSSAFLVPTEKITALDVARGTHTNKAKYAMVGLMVGALGGAAVGAATYSPPKCNSNAWCIDFDSAGMDAALGAVLFGGLGALVGAIAGQSPRDNWVPVQLPQGR